MLSSVTFYTLLFKTKPILRLNSIPQLTLPPHTPVCLVTVHQEPPPPRVVLNQSPTPNSSSPIPSAIQTNNLVSSHGTVDVAVSLEEIDVIKAREIDGYQKPEIYPIVLLQTSFQSQQPGYFASTLCWHDDETGRRNLSPVESGINRQKAIQGQLLNLS